MGAGAVVESRELHIDKRVFTLRDVQKLAGLLSDEATADSSGRGARVEFSVGCADESDFTSTDDTLFSDNSPIATKRVKGIEMTLFGSNDAYVSIRLTHVAEPLFDPYWNTINVSGTDSNWVNGTMKKLEELVGSFTPQDHFLVRHRELVKWTLALVISGLYFWALFRLHSLLGSLSSEPSPLIVLVDLIPSVLGGYASGWLIASQIPKLWPAVEIQIGPEHTLIEKRRRKWLTSSFVLLILPLLLELVTEAIKR